MSCLAYVCLCVDILYQRKERREHSLNRNFFGDYIGLDEKAGLRTLVGKRDKVEFAQTVTRFAKKFKVNCTSSSVDQDFLRTGALNLSRASRAPSATWS